MLVLAPASDYYWTNRSLLLPDSTLKYVRDYVAGGSPGVAWEDHADGGFFHPQTTLLNGA